MEYEIKDIQTVTVKISDDEPSKDVTCLEVLYTWGAGYSNKSRLEIQGKATDAEIMAAISKRGGELKAETFEEPGRSVPTKGTL